jgi:hypothetical protein
VLYRQGCARAHDPWDRTGGYPSDDEDPERFSSVLLPSHVRVGGRPRSRHLAQLTAQVCAMLCIACGAEMHIARIEQDAAIRRPDTSTRHGNAFAIAKQTARL